VQAYLVRHGMEANPLDRRDLVTSIIEALLNPGKSEPTSDGSGSRRSNRAAVDAAKAHIQPLVLEHMDVAAAADMPRAVFEAQLSGWVKDLLTESKMQLNFIEQRELVESLIADMLGLGPLEPLIEDETVTDILVNGAKQVYVERRGKLELTDVVFRDDDHVMNVATKIVTRVGRRIDESQPLVDARLTDGSRVNIITPPLAIDGPSISIRKFSKKTITLDTMAQQANISPQMATFLKITARCRLNILISGGTGSGKTTLLNALSRLIDLAERTVTIEDAAELQMQQPHVVRLETRPPNLECTGEITMRDLLRNALRMRPDRIILGEIRGAEALDVLQAMNTGHDGSMSTIHANSPREALTRLENMVGMTGINLPSKAVRTQIAAAVHLIAQVNRMRDGVRRVTHIMEVVGMEGDTITTQELFSFQFQGESADGMLRGVFKSNGIRPFFLPRAEYYGLDRPLLEVI
jgi:pilus assembly protein CpaF